MKNVFEEKFAEYLKDQFTTVLYETSKVSVKIPHVPDFFVPELGLILEVKGSASHFDRVKMLGMSNLCKEGVDVDGHFYYRYIVCPILSNREWEFYNPLSWSETSSNSMTIGGLHLCDWLKQRGVLVSPFTLLDDKIKLCNGTPLYTEIERLLRVKQNNQRPIVTDEEIDSWVRQLPSEELNSKPENLALTKPDKYVIM